ncbi:hypothetical protein BN2364_2005 [Alloalcanivorax xenomutans]|nr:hypothetical protein BN2364_2005 [Alloalcanivorax xenomutans]
MTAFQRFSMQPLRGLPITGDPALTITQIRKSGLERKFENG